jgi:branched-chain amino acid transport system permease protein
MTNFMQFFISGLLVGGIYSLVAVIVVLVYKSTRVVSIAHGQLLAFSALFFWFFIGGLGCPLWISFFIALILSGLMGFLVERLTMRPLIGQPLFSAFLMTFAIFMFLNGGFQLYLQGQSRAFPPFLPKGIIHLQGVSVSQDQVISFLISIFFFMLLVLFFKFTRVGLNMRATAEHHSLAQSAGIRVRTIFTIVWIMSAIGACIAGIAAANVMDIHYPLPFIGIKGLIVAILGGLESIGGAFLAGLILGVVENVAGGYLDPIVGGGVMEVAAYVVLLFILLVKPYGLFGLEEIERI